MSAYSVSGRIPRPVCSTSPSGVSLYGKETWGLVTVASLSAGVPLGVGETGVKSAPPPPSQPLTSTATDYNVTASAQLFQNKSLNNKSWQLLQNRCFLVHLFVVLFNTDQ